MSAIPTCSIMCDECGARHDDLGAGIVGEALARRSAHAHGWQTRKTRGRWIDICPTCQHEVSDPFLCDIGRGDVRRCVTITPKQGDTE